jgi:hypothetical protein
MPVVMTNDSEPEPDIAVLAPGTPFGRRTVDDVLLVIEVAHRTRRFDLERKAPRITPRGVPEITLDLDELFAAIPKS